MDRKQCPQCQAVNPTVAEICIRCGHIFRTQFRPPQVAAPPVQMQVFQQPQFQSQPVYQAPHPTQVMGGFDELANMARRHNDHQRTFMWTLIGGLFCLWPLFIITYLEHVKMRDIRDQVARMNVDVTWWRINYHVR